MLPWWFKQFKSSFNDMILPRSKRDLRKDNPRALASGLSYVQVDKHGITTSVYEIFRAKVGKRGISSVRLY